MENSILPGRNRGWKVKQEPEAATAAVQSKQLNSEAADFFFFWPSCIYGSEE